MNERIKELLPTHKDIVRLAGQQVSYVGYPYEDNEYVGEVVGAVLTIPDYYVIKLSSGSDEGLQFEYRGVIWQNTYMFGDVSVGDILTYAHGDDLSIYKK